MHVLTNAEKLIPLRDAASLAESRRLAGMRMVTGTTSPSTRYERISVSPASCSIKSEYVIASHAFKPQYKCINYIPAWEQRKLGDVTDSFSGGTPDGSHASYYGGSIPFIRSAEINSDKTELFLTEKGLDNSSAKIVERGTVLYALYGATSGEVGIAAIKGAINQAILALSPHTGNDPLFLASWLRREKARIVDTYLQGGQGNLSGSIVKELSFALPQQKEQQVIGSFFSHLDNLITLHQRKYDKLVVFKKSMLEKMFPKDGESVPEIRFAGFTDPWEQRKLGELEKDATLYMGRGRVISAKDMSNTPGTFPVYSSSALDNGRMGAYGKYMFNQELITWSIDGGGAVFYRRKHRFSVTNVSGYIAVNPEKINCKFLAYAMSLAHSRIKFDYTVKAHPSVIRSLYTMGIPISLQEQQVIGSFFSRLDNLITLHQRKLELLQNIKKSLLDKMFV